MTEKEKNVYTLIQRLNTLKNEKDKKREERDVLKKKIKEAQIRGQKKDMEITKKKFKQEKQKDKFRKKMKNNEDD